jgi:uncharacterized protein DUF3291
LTAAPRQLAQVNLARLRHPVGSPELAGFLAAVDRINARAEQSPGFVWRLQSAGGHLNGAELLNDPLAVVNLSVWESYPPLHDFVYRNAHGSFVRKRGQWFLPLPGPTTALWWVTAGDHPTAADALARLTYLRNYGPTSRAFTVRTRFTATGQREARRQPATGMRMVPVGGSTSLVR